MLFCINGAILMRRQLSLFEVLACLGAGALVLVGLSVFSAKAGEPTPDGRISVAQVMEMAGKAKENPMAMQVLMAYLTGVGETAGILLSAKGPNGQAYVSCRGELSMDESAMVAALEGAAPDAASQAVTAATPVLVNVIMMRGKCS